MKTERMCGGAVTCEYSNYLWTEQGFVVRNMCSKSDGLFRTMFQALLALTPLISDFVDMMKELPSVHLLKAVK